LFDTSILRAYSSLLLNAIFSSRISAPVNSAIDLYSRPNLLPRPNRYDHSAHELFTEIFALRIISNSHTIRESKLVRRNMQLTQACAALALYDPPQQSRQNLSLARFQRKTRRASVRTTQ